MQALAASYTSQPPTSPLPPLPALAASLRHCLTTDHWPFPPSHAAACSSFAVTNGGETVLAVATRIGATASGLMQVNPGFATPQTRLGRRRVCVPPRPTTG